MIHKQVLCKSKCCHKVKQMTFVYMKLMIYAEYSFANCLGIYRVKVQKYTLYEYKCNIIV